MADSNGNASVFSSPRGRRILKWGGGLLGTLVVLVLVVAFALPRLFTSEQLKGYVIPPLEEATGRQVEIDAIGLRVLWTPAVRATGFRLANDERFDAQPAVSARTLNVEVALWPLLTGTIRPTAVVLEDPVVRYTVAEDGTTNFETLGGADTTATDEDAAPLGGIPVSDFRTTGAQVHYTDRSTGRSLRLAFDAQLNVLPEGSALTSAGSVDLRSVRALLPEIGPDTLALQEAQATYDVRVDPSAGQIDLRSLQLDTAPISLTASGTVAGLNERPTVDLTFETERTDLAEIAAFVPAAAVEGFNPQGSLALKGTLSGSLSDTTDAARGLSLAATGELADAGIDYEGTALLRDLSADLSLALDSVAVRSVEGRLLGASLTGNVSVQDLEAEPQLTLQVETGPMNLADLAAFIPPEQVDDYNPLGTLRLDATATGLLPTDAAALENFTFNGTGQLAGFGVEYGGSAVLQSLKANLQFTNTTVSAQEIDGQLLGNPLSGAVTLRDLMGSPQVDGQLAGTVDLPPLLALMGEESASESFEGTADFDMGFTGPLDTPDAIRPDGRVRLTEVQVPYESFRAPIGIPDATVQLTGTGLSMDRFTVQSGQQSVALQTTIRDLFPISEGLADPDPALSASFTLTSDRLDLVELYPEAQDSDVYYSQLFAAHLAGSEVDGASPEALAEKLYGDVELPAYDVEGRVEIDTLLNDPQRFEDLAFDVRMVDRRLTLRNLTGSTYGGTLAGTLTLDQRGSTTSAVRSPDDVVQFASMSTSQTSARPRPAPQSNLTYELRLEGAETGTVLRDWTTLGRLVTGTLTFEADGDSRLTSGLLPETTALSAIGESVVADGGLSLDVGPAQALVDALNLPESSIKQFERLGGPFAIEDGQLQMKRWAFEADRFNGTLQGALGLRGELDLEMMLDLPLALLQESNIAGRVGDGDGQLGTVLKKLIGSPVDDESIRVSVQFGGTMRDPTVQVLNRDAIKSRIESLAKEAGLNRLRDLFGGGGSGR